MDNQLLSIKDFSTLAGIKQSTLRYYDDIGLFSPAMRGDNGYRYYAPQQITTINCIKLLYSLDIPIKDISALSKKRSPELMLKLLLGQEERLDAELRVLQKARNIINVFRNNIFTGITANEDELSLVFMHDQPIILGPVNEFKSPDSFHDGFLHFCELAETLRVNLTYPIGGYFPDMEFFSKNPTQPQKFFSIDPSGGTMKKAGRYLVGYKRGYYGTSLDLPQRMLSYAEEHKLNFSGPVYAIFLIDEISESDAGNYLQQISVQVQTEPA
jgi:DNA-binding transcriptional MerR regulator